MRQTRGAWPAHTFELFRHSLVVSSLPKASLRCTSCEASIALPQQRGTSNCKINGHVSIKIIIFQGQFSILSSFSMEKGEIGIYIAIRSTQPEPPFAVARLELDAPVA